MLLSCGSRCYCIPPYLLSGLPWCCTFTFPILIIYSSRTLPSFLRLLSPPDSKVSPPLSYPLQTFSPIICSSRCAHLSFFFPNLSLHLPQLYLIKSLSFLFFFISQANSPFPLCTVNFCYSFLMCKSSFSLSASCNN